MNYFLYQLQFSTPVHFGSSDSALSLYQSEDHFHADTLFSALCHTALQLEGDSGLGRLLASAQNGELLLSDSMPWIEDRFYLPKPVFSPQIAPELPGDKRKAMKKLAWIAADEFEGYCDALKTGTPFEAGVIRFGDSAEAAKVSGRGEAAPYPVGLFRFREACGLYVLAACRNVEDGKWLSKLLRGLGWSGIGGKVSAGYGKFEILDEIELEGFFDAQTEWLYTALTRESGTSMLLTSSLPEDAELDRALDGASYRLVRRAGFAASDSNEETPTKKRTQYFLGAGSVVKHRFAGGLYEVGRTAGHGVFRYAKPLFLGVNL